MIDLKLDRVFYTNDKTVLTDVNIEIKEGEILTILGKSGCGKSTLLKIIAGLHTNYEGTVRIDSDRIGYIPQSKCLLPWKTVYENLVLLKKIEAAVSQDEAAVLLERLQIDKLKDKYVNKLSGGEYQRVTLGQVFFYEPKIILMDEPFSALDSQTKDEILHLFLTLQREKMITTVFVTHNIGEAEFVQGRIIRL